MGIFVGEGTENNLKLIARYTVNGPQLDIVAKRYSDSDSKLTSTTILRNVPLNSDSPISQCFSEADLYVSAPLPPPPGDGDGTPIVWE